MRTDSTCEAWACIDCIMLVANGDVPERFSEDELADWLAGIDRRWEGYHLVPGSDDDVEFSWTRCEVCGCSLGGSRHAVVAFLR